MAQISYGSGFVTAGSAEWAPQTHQAYRGGDGVITPPPPPPDGDPTNLVAVQGSGTDANLTWDDNSTNEEGFSIEQSLDGTTGWTVIGSSLTNSYVDPSLPLGIYYYRVRAVNAGGNSGYSNVDDVTIQEEGGGTGPTPIFDANIMDDKALPAGWSTLRATGMWGVDASGLLYHVPANTMALWHDPHTLVCKGARHMPVTTNDMLHSNQPTNTDAWVQGWSLTTAYDVTGPDGTANSILRSSTGGSSGSYFRQDINYGNHSTSIAISILVSKNSATPNTWIGFLYRHYGGSNLIFRQTMNVTTGAIGTSATAPAHFVVHDFSPDFWRVEMSNPNDGTNNVFRLEIYTSQTEDATGYPAGESSFGWIQAEYDRVWATDYVGHTAGSAVSRSTQAIDGDVDAGSFALDANSLVVHGSVEREGSVGKFVDCNYIADPTQSRLYTELFASALAGGYSGGGVDVPAPTLASKPAVGTDFGIAVTASAAEGIEHSVDGAQVGAAGSGANLPWVNAIDTIRLYGVDVGFNFGRVIGFAEDIGDTERDALSVYGSDPSGGGGPPPGPGKGYLGTTYEEWDTWYEGLTAGNKPSFGSPDVTVNVATWQQLIDALDDALGATAAAANRVTLIQQTADIDGTGSRSHWVGVREGAVAMWDGNGFDVTGDNTQTRLVFQGQNPSGDEGWEGYTQVTAVTYTGSGEGWYTDEAIFTVTTVPPNLKEGDIFKVWVPKTDSNTTVEYGALVWCREPADQKFGIPCKVKAINGNNIEVHGPLYDYGLNYYQDWAAAGRLYGMRQTSTHRAVWLSDVKINRTNRQNTLMFENLNEPLMLDSVVECVDTSGAAFEFKILSHGCYGPVLWDCTGHNPDNAELVNLYWMGSLFGARRYGAVSTGVFPRGLTYNTRNWRHGVDTASGSYRVNNGLAPEVQAVLVGACIEPFEKDLTHARQNAEVLVSHSAAHGYRREGCIFSEDQDIGSQQFRAIADRSNGALSKGFTIQASRFPSGSLSLITHFDGSKFNNKTPNSTSMFHALHEDLIVDMDATGRNTFGNSDSKSPTGPYYTRYSTFLMKNPNANFSGALNWRCGDGSDSNVNGTIEDLIPGFALNIDVGSEIAMMGNFDEDAVVVSDANGMLIGTRVTFNGMTTNTLTAVRAVRATDEMHGRIYIENKPAGVTLVPTAGSGDFTDVQVIEGLAPTVLPDPPTISVTPGVSKNSIIITPDPSDNHSVFWVEWSPDAVVWKRLGVTGPVNLTYSDDDAQTGVVRHYRCRAQNGVRTDRGYSDWSNTGSGTPT